MASQRRDVKQTYASAVRALQSLQAEKAIAPPSVTGGERPVSDVAGLKPPEDVTQSSSGGDNSTEWTSSGGLATLEKNWSERFSDFKSTVIWWILGTGIAGVLAVAGLTWGMLALANSASSTVITSTRDELLRENERLREQVKQLEVRTQQLEQRSVRR